jgi:dihydropteroate synthase
MFDKYMFALGRGVRGVMQALDEDKREAPVDPAQAARDVTPRPAQVEAQNAARDSAPLAGVALTLGPTARLMGVVNVTPDSFSDGGLHFDAGRAVAHGERLAAEGAHLLDVGGESTRPGAQPVSAQEEMARVLPVVRALAASTGLPISIDTMKAQVAARAIENGASVVNDVWGFQRDPDMARVVAQAGVHCVLMHNRAAEDPAIDIFADCVAFLRRSVDLALAAGVARDKIVIDPGVGFARSHAQSFELIRRIGELRALFGLPVLLGVSRKRCIGAATGQTVAAERVAGSLAAHLYGALQGADVVRAHDVAAHAQGLAVLSAIEGRVA